MCDYRISDFEDYKDCVFSTDDGDDDFISHDAYSPETQPQFEQSTRDPLLECLAEGHSANGTTQSNGSSLPKLLSTTPGILPGGHSFPHNYELRPDTEEYPKVIMDGFYNSVPVILSEDYFKFKKNSETDIMNSIIQNSFNNLNASNSNSSSNGRRNHCLGNFGSSSSDDNTKVNDEYKNHSNKTVQTKDTNENKKRYYNAFEIYQMNRHKK